MLTTVLLGIIIITLALIAALMLNILSYQKRLDREFQALWSRTESTSVKHSAELITMKARLDLFDRTKSDKRRPRKETAPS